MALLLGSCSGQDDATLGEPGAQQPPAPNTADGVAPPFGEPSPDTLSLLGGQTGSDLPTRSAGPCGVEVLADYGLATETPLGFSGDDVIENLLPRDVQLRWADATRGPARLTFTPGAAASLVSRPTGEPDTCVQLLRLNVTVTLSSSEPGVDGTWVTLLYAGAPDALAGTGVAGRDTLGATLLARSGDGDVLRLTYALDADVFDGWLLAGGAPPEVVAELDEE